MKFFFIISTVLWVNILPSTFLVFHESNNLGIPIGTGKHSLCGTYVDWTVNNCLKCVKIIVEIEVALSITKAMVKIMFFLLKNALNRNCKTNIFEVVDFIGVTVICEEKVLQF